MVEIKTWCCGTVICSGGTHRGAVRSAIHRGVSLAHADLRGLALDFMDLRGADLRQSDLRDTDFEGTCLSRANLQQSLVEDADFTEADLSNADCRGANLGRAATSGAATMGMLLGPGDTLNAQGEVQQVGGYWWQSSNNSIARFGSEVGDDSN